MKEIKGKFNSAKIFAEKIDETAEEEIRRLLDQEYLKASKIRIMPDCHSGKGCVIGMTMTLTDRACPNLVGVDIGCGMLATKLKEREIDFRRLDDVIRKYVPSGMEVHDTPVIDYDLAEIRADIREEYDLMSLGTLGGGNHFIEVDRDSSGFLWLVIHSGSRHLGVEVATYYQKKAIKACNSMRDESDSLIARMKAEGRQREISSALEELKESRTRIPDELCYVKGKDCEDYLHDMKIVQGYAILNRCTMTKQILEHAGLHAVESFDTVHNYIDTDSMILRKGAISAQKGERVMIPMNMRDGSLICVGKGNPDWNFSGPHGAGRVMSRSEAKRTLDLNDFEASMSGIWTSTVCDGTIDEAPMVYKPVEEIIKAVESAVDIVDLIKPVYNYKATE